MQRSFCVLFHPEEEICMFSPRYAIGRRRENVGCLPRHQITQHRIAETLLAYTKDHGGVACDTPIDVVFSDYDVLQPDVLYFKGGRAQLVDLDRPIRHAPDLCVGAFTLNGSDRPVGLRCRCSRATASASTAARAG